MAIATTTDPKRYLKNESHSMLPKISLKVNLHTVSCMMTVTDLSTKLLLIVHYQSKAFFIFFDNFIIYKILSLINRENTVEIKGFVGSEEECKSHCADNFECVYYHYVPAGDDKCPLFCYLLHKCTPRRIEEKNCPLTKENYIDHFLFVETVTDW